jgi:hypothetical protein
MSGLVFHSVEPESNKSTFGEFDTVDFIIATDRNLVKNSVRIEGVLEIDKTTGQRATYTDRIYMNPRVGAHSLVESCRTEVNGSIVENIKTDYPRFVHMIQSATKSPDDYFAGSQLCEMKCSTVDGAIAYACGKSDKTDQAQIFGDHDFSFKPVIALNRSDADVEMRRLGNEIRVSLNLARKENALAGFGQVATSNYIIRDLRLTYTTAPPAPVPSVSMRSVVDIKSVLQSSNANISTRVPAVCQSVSVSFLKQSKENSLNVMTDALEKPPNLSEVQFLFNDASNQLVQFQLKDYAEYMDGYLESFKSGGVSSANPQTIKGNSVFGVGLDFGSSVDLSQNKFSVQLKSDVSNANQYIMYLFFHSQISL